MLVRVGGSTLIRTDARVVAATNQNLAEMVGQKGFREDLYFRLNVVTIELPPLRDRPGDVTLLAEHFLVDFCKKAHRGVPRFSDDARKRLEGHAWPGNIRELRNLMERLAYLSREDVIEAEDLAFILSPPGRRSAARDFDQPLSDATAAFQADYIRQAIDRAGGNWAAPVFCTKGYESTGWVETAGFRLCGCCWSVGAAGAETAAAQPAANSAGVW